MNELIIRLEAKGQEESYEQKTLCKIIAGQ